jgi:epsilon-lactone hydrolase
MTDDAVPARGSLRSRGAAPVSASTLRQISAVLPPEQAWAFGPSLTGISIEPVDIVEPDGHRVVGEWVRASGIPAKQGKKAG